MTFDNPSYKTKYKLQNTFIISGALSILAILLHFFEVGESILLGAVALSLIAVRSLQRKSGRLIPVPVIPVTALILSGAAAFLYYPQIQDDALVSMDIPYNQSQYALALFIYVVAALLIWAGGWLILKPVTIVASQKGKMAFDVRLWGPFLLIATAIPIALVVYGFGIEALFERRHYLDIPGSAGAVSLSLLAMPIGAAVSSFVMLHPKTTMATRSLAILVLVCYLCVYAGTGSRGLGLVPAIILIVCVLVRRLSLIVYTSLAVVASYVSLSAMSLTLQVRQNAGSAGILPTFAFLVSDDYSWRIDPAELFGNILFGLPLTGQIATTDRLPAFGFWTSISPLPSGLTQWDELQPLVSWGPATPYNALGELLDYGLLQFLFYIFCIGAVFALIDNSVAKYSGFLRDIILLACLSTSILFTTGLLQYPLRNTSRYIWYLITALLVAKLVIYFLSHLRFNATRSYTKSTSRMNLTQG